MKTKLIKGLFFLLVFVMFGCSKEANTTTPVETVKTKVKITGFKVENIPFVAPDGLGWDGVSGLPDVYCGLFNGNSTLVVTSNVSDNVAQSSLPLTVTFNIPYQVPFFSDTINIVVMDSDQNNTPVTDDDEIGYVPFVLNDYTTGADKYPSTVTKTANGVTTTLFLIWE